MRVALYTRVSDKDRQGDNTSIGSQLEAMRKYAVEQGYVVIDEFTEMESASKYGAGLERTELGNARKLAQQKKIDALIFYSTNRFTRDIGDGVVLRRELYKLNVKLICYYPHPHEITSDKELFNILEDYISEQYVENLREASMRGTKATALAGVYHSGHAPYGYELVGRRLDKKLLIVEEQARVVRMIFAWFCEDNLSTGEIARKLTDLQIKTPGEDKSLRIRKRESSEWTRQYIRVILTQEAYAGTTYAHKYKGIGKNKKILRPREERIPIPVPVIIDRPMWEYAQQRLKERDFERKKQEDHTKKYLMSRRCKCDVCNSSMHGVFRRTNNTRLYYVCLAPLSRPQIDKNKVMARKSLAVVGVGMWATRSVVHMSTRRPSHAACTSAGVRYPKLWWSRSSL